ncbi:chromate transporter [Vibrio sp.]|nr:chromate transporter [Vibrio sp.]
MLDTYMDIFWAFFIPNIIGYGGGPAIIPLIETQVVTQYGWLTPSEFANVLALGNALPSPVVTKIAGYIGYELGGITGAAIAIFATVAPTLIIMITSLGVLYKFRDSPQVKALGQWVLPVITALMVILCSNLFSSAEHIGWPAFAGIFIVTAILLEKVKLHPTWAIASSLIFGAVFLG